ncbi:MAG: dihydropteroate synthase [Propionicimonas sp.]
MTHLPAPGRTLVMGILNVTPDSFSDGGEHLNRNAAIAHGLRLLAEGADVIDVGGESTRPGAERSPVATELARVLPVVTELAGRGAVVSVDTMRAAVAARAIEAGAAIVNDVSAGLADPAMLDTVAGLGVGFVAMHWRGHSDVMQSLSDYDDVVGEVVSALAERRDAALAAGVAADNLVLDPGLGFAKTAAHNWELLRHLDQLASLGKPLLIGASRKRFLGELLAVSDVPRPPKQRDDATVALTALLALKAVWGVRTHTVAAQRDAIAVAQRLSLRFDGGQPGPAGSPGRVVTKGGR